MLSKHFLGASLVAVAAVVAVAGIGVTIAQAGGDDHEAMMGGGTEAHGAMMAGDGMDGHGEMMAGMAEHHETAMAAVAAALGMSVDELQEEMAAGQTVPAIAAERGVSPSLLWETMHADHPGDEEMAGMMGDGVSSGCTGMSGS